MPQSPYHDIIYPPVDDIETIRDDIREIRIRHERDESYGQSDTWELLDNADLLLDQCDFLNGKTRAKVRIHLDFISLSQIWNC